jgi:ABC-type glutathione transport system ATPase component
MTLEAADVSRDAIVSVRDLQVGFQTADRRAIVKAVDGVSFDVRRGETFGIIGESGSGKTTIGRALVFLLKPSGGAILHNGVDPLAMPRQQFQNHRRDYQIIFQDPNAALNPRMTILARTRRWTASAWPWISAIAIRTSYPAARSSAS